MSATLLHIETSPTLPSEADVVVIGGGVVGVFTAYYLARSGVKVALVEKGRIAAEQSSRNWGWCRQQNRDARELPMATKSLELWDKIAEETGEDPGFRRCGLLYLSQDEAEIAGPLAGFLQKQWALPRICSARVRPLSAAKQPGRAGKVVFSRQLTELLIRHAQFLWWLEVSWQPAELFIRTVPPVDLN